VSEQHDNQETAQIERVSDDLTRALKLCHSLVDDYRSKLAANFNDMAPANDEDDDSRLG
jgi:hypothetical protein